MWHWLAVGLMTWAGGDVEVTQLGGVKATGPLQELTAEALVVRLPDGDKRVELRNVLSVLFPHPTQSEPKPGVVVELVDGSIFTADAVSVVRGVAKLSAGGGVSIECRTRQIRSLRFVTTPGLDQAWQEITSQKIEGDTLIIRKPSRNDAADQPGWVLDRQAGIVHDITPEVVQFEIDGDRIPVKREKLEGLLFFTPIMRELLDPIGRVLDVSGGRWNAKSLRLAGDRIELELPAGITVALPLDQIHQLDFSSGNTVYLSDLEPDAQEWTPFVESRAAAARLIRLYQPRRDQAFGGGKLTLAGQSFDKGLAVHSRTTMTYRVPRNFKRLLATVGIDDRVRETGHVRLVISGDNRVLFDQPISGKDPPVEVDLDLTSVRRVTLLVDFGEGLDIADHLDLANARITK